MEQNSRKSILKDWFERDFAEIALQDQEILEAEELRRYCILQGDSPGEALRKAITDFLGAQINPAKYRPIGKKAS